MMDSALKFISWKLNIVKRGWPVWIAILFVALHFFFTFTPCLITSVCPSNTTGNKYIAGVMQLVGVIIVVMNLESNHRIIRGESLKVSIKGYLRNLLDFKRPEPRNITITVEPGTYSMTGHNADVSLWPSDDSGRIEELKRLVDNLRLQQKEHYKIHDTSIAGLKSEISAHHENVTSSLAEHKENRECSKICVISVN